MRSTIAMQKTAGDSWRRNCEKAQTLIALLESTTSAYKGFSYGTRNMLITFLKALTENKQSDVQIAIKDIEDCLYAMSKSDDQIFEHTAVDFYETKEQWYQRTEKLMHQLNKTGEEVKPPSEPKMVFFAGQIHSAEDEMVKVLAEGTIGDVLEKEDSDEEKEDFDQFFLVMLKMNITTLKEIIHNIETLLPKCCEPRKE